MKKRCNQCGKRPRFRLDQVSTDLDTPDVPPIKNILYVCEDCILKMNELAERSGISIEKSIKHAKRKCAYCPKYTSSSDGTCPSCSVKFDLDSLLQNDEIDAEFDVNDEEFHTMSLNSEEHVENLILLASEAKQRGVKIDARAPPAAEHRRRLPGERPASVRRAAVRLNHRA